MSADAPSRKRGRAARQSPPPQPQTQRRSTRARAKMELDDGDVVLLDEGVAEQSEAATAAAATELEAAALQLRQHHTELDRRYITVSARPDMRPDDGTGAGWTFDRVPVLQRPRWQRLQRLQSRSVRQPEL